MFDPSVLPRSSVHDAVELVRGLESAGDDGAMVEQLSELEDLKRACSAAQARITARLVASQRAAQVGAGVPSRRAHRGVSEQVALARRESPHRGGTFVGMANALVHEMSCTMAALTSGSISEWGATCLVRETATLQAQDRIEVDRRLAPMLADPGVGERRLTRAATGIAQQLDPAAAVRRAAKAETDRRVCLRPAPDTMGHLSALLPVAEAVSVLAALRTAAGAAAAAGDSRTRGQVMADTLVARVTGRDPLTEPVPVQVELVMTDATLFGHATSTVPTPAGPTPAEARVSAGGATVRARGQAPVPIPTALARRLSAAAAAAGQAWIRRLYTTPDGAQLVAMDSRARRFPAGLSQLIALADQTCRTPWCDAPIRATDHVQAFADGGSTAAENAQGLCERCNHAKQAPGWSARRHPDGSVDTTTPTGHTYRSVRPPVLGYPPTHGAHETDSESGWPDRLTG